MTQEVFYEVIKHIKEHTSATIENPMLVILDNHESHIQLDTIIYCKENGRKPLDVAVVALFKSHCKLTFNKWITENPGKTISIQYMTLPNQHLKKRSAEKIYLRASKKLEYSLLIVKYSKRKTL